jgi:tetratricopeptide (TPR) repeat protein
LATKRLHLRIWLLAVLSLAAVAIVVWRLGMQPDREPQRAENPEAHNHYLQAARLAGSGDAASLVKAVGFYESALKADPDYALAWAGLARAWTLLAQLGEVRPNEVLPKAADAAARALKLGERLPEAHHAAGRVRVMYEHDWAGAEQAFLRAIELDPKNVEARYDYARLVLKPTVRFTDAAEQLKGAIALDPSDPAVVVELANTYILARRLHEAAQPIEAARKLIPQEPETLVMLGSAATSKGNLEEALKYFEEAARHSRSNWVLGHLGYALARLGRKEETAKVVAELERVPAGKEPADYELGVIHTALGETYQAFAELERAAGLLSPSTLWIKVDPRLQDLRRHSRFRMLLRDMRLE